jgi:predicted amidohydrolase YtcJ
MLADFVVLDANPFSEKVSNIRNISVLETHLAGKKVFVKS